MPDCRHGAGRDRNGSIPGIAPVRLNRRHSRRGTHGRRRAAALQQLDRDGGADRGVAGRADQAKPECVRGPSNSSTHGGSMTRSCSHLKALPALCILGALIAFSAPAASAQDAPGSPPPGSTPTNEQCEQAQQDVASLRHGSGGGQQPGVREGEPGHSAQAGDQPHIEQAKEASAQTQAHGCPEVAEHSQGPRGRDPRTADRCQGDAGSVLTATESAGCLPVAGAAGPVAGSPFFKERTRSA